MAEEPVEQKPSGSTRTQWLGWLKDAAVNLATILKTQERMQDELNRFRSDVKDLAKETIAQAKDVKEVTGQLKGIDKRFDEVDRRMELLVQAKVAEAIAKHERDKHGS
jgi:predicted nuclease with TOPRIM domain